MSEIGMVSSENLAKVMRMAQENPNMNTDLAIQRLMKNLLLGCVFILFCGALVLFSILRP